MIEHLAFPGLKVDATLDGTPHGVEIEEHLVGLLGADSAEVQQYLVLRQTIERAHAASGVSVVAVTSGALADGKTTTAINLAGALARNPGARILLVDADLRAPSVATRLGVRRGQMGLADLLADARIALADVAFRRQPFNLSVLTAGRLRKNDPYELLQSRRFAEVIAEARQSYDYVVIDTPPAVPVPDCRVIEPIIDAFLIVVSAHRTPQRLLEETLNILGPEKSLGIVFNRADRRFRGCYGPYYGYGYPASNNRD